MSRIGVDIDGVLADFNVAYIQKCIDISGRDLFPTRPFDILTWNYPESYGYTKEEISDVWASIMASPFFWRNLKAYPTASADLDALYERQEIHGDEIYFITARPGILVKAQTEWWLKVNCYYSEFTNPTVLISSHKGLCAAALGLDAYIDDRDTNVIDVHSHCDTKTFIMDRTWNRGIGDFCGGITRVSSVEEMLANLPSKA